MLGVSVCIIIISRVSVHFTEEFRGSFMIKHSSVSSTCAVVQNDSSERA
jgi:hypothetical protein